MEKDKREGGNFDSAGKFLQGNTIGQLQATFGPQGRRTQFDKLCKIIGKELKKKTKFDQEILDELESEGLQLTSYLAARKLIVYMIEPVPKEDTVGRYIAFGALKEHLARIVPKVQSVEMKIEKTEDIKIHIEDSRLNTVLNDFMTQERQKYAIPENGNGDGNGNGGEPE